MSRSADGRTTTGGGPAPYHHGNLRAALVEAGLALVKEVPASRLSLREVARVAGVSHGAPYHHFADKDELLAALGTESLRRFVEAQREAVAGVEGAGARLLAMGAAYVGFAIEHPHEFGLVFDPALVPPADVRPENGALLDAVQGQLVGLTAGAQEAGLLPPGNSATLAHALWGMVHGLAGLVQLGHFTYDDALASLRSVVGGGGRDQS